MQRKGSGSGGIRKEERSEDGIGERREPSRFR